MLLASNVTNKLLLNPCPLSSFEGVKKSTFAFAAT